MILEESIEDVKSHIDIIDIVSSYIQLHKRGNAFKANCPFHDEKTPSFVVSQDKQFYHCFGCGVGGDAISFIMSYEKLSYVETIEKLALMYNISLQYSKSKDNYNTPINFSILEQVNSHYRDLLEHSSDTLAYLKDRGVYESSIEKFSIGLSKENEEFMSFLSFKNIQIEDSNRVGILGKGSNNDYYAIFRERIMFPIYSSSNKIVGFGGRTVVGHDAKYINSPQNALFNKSRLLYGYPQAKSNIIKAKEAIITEGYLDVIMLHQAGFTNAVATLGTAITKEHIPLVAKLTKNIILAFDGDKAGKNAGYKALLLLQHYDMNAKIAIFEDNIDPADMVANNEIEKLQYIFKHAKMSIEYILEFIVLKYDLKDPTNKQQAFNECMSFFKNLDTVMQFEYKSFLANLLQIDDNLILPRRKKRETRVELSSEDLGELCVLKTLLIRPKLLNELLEYIEPEMFYYHQNEFLSILNDAQDHSSQKLLLREDLYELDDEKIFEQISVLMTRFYKNLRRKQFKENLNNDKKSYIMRKLEEKIKSLQNNHLPVFDENYAQYFE